MTDSWTVAFDTCGGARCRGMPRDLAVKVRSKDLEATPQPSRDDLLYLLQGAAWAVVGVFRLAGPPADLVVTPGMPAAGLPAAAAAGDAKEYMHLHSLATEARRVRGMVLAGEVIAPGCRGGGTDHLGAVVGLVAGRSGRAALAGPCGPPADRRIISAATVTPRFRKLTSDIVLRAYYSARLGHPDKPDQRITFAPTMQRDGDGSRVLVDLPFGMGRYRQRPGRAGVAGVPASRTHQHPPVCPVGR
jgi:hypothetical protein